MSSKSHKYISLKRNLFNKGDLTVLNTSLKRLCNKASRTLPEKVNNYTDNGHWRIEKIQTNKTRNSYYFTRCYHYNILLAWIFNTFLTQSLCQYEFLNSFRRLWNHWLLWKELAFTCALLRLILWRNFYSRFYRLPLCSCD